MISLTSGIISSSESKHHVVHEKWNVSSIWVYKGCHSAQQLQPPWRASLWALRELRKERTPAIQQPSDGRDHLLSSGLQRTPAIQWPSETTCHPEAFREHLPASSRETVETTCHPAAIRRQRPPAVQQPWDCRDHLPSSSHQTAETTCRPAAFGWHPLPTVSPQETQDGKTQDSGPRKLRYRSKEWFQWAWTLAPFQTKKSTEFLTLGYLVLAYSPLLTQWLCCKASVQLVSPTCLLRAVFSGSLEMLPPGLKS